MLTEIKNLEKWKRTKKWKLAEVMNFDKVKTDREK